MDVDIRLNQVALKEHLEMRLVAERALTDEKISTLIKDIEKTAVSLSVRLTYERQVTDEKILALVKDIEKSAVVLNHRLESLNALRTQVVEDRGQFVRKEQFDLIVRQIYVATGAVGMLIMLVRWWLK